MMELLKLTCIYWMLRVENLYLRIRLWSLGGGWQKRAE